MNIFDDDFPSYLEKEHQAQLDKIVDADREENEEEEIESDEDDQS